MSNWQLTVGMEIHVELETETKMFCGCKNDPFHAAPNTNVCPVCYGLPGALPLLNKEAIAMVVRFGRAVHATIPSETFWARKNYFYPDLPKGYQISQSALPLVQGGVIVIDGTEHRLHHAHLEEDAGKLMHVRRESSHANKLPVSEWSEVNYNRAGVPLLEIVTEPDFHSAESVKRFCQELQRIMRSLKISSADMEKGYMRCEANISVSQSDQLGTKVEVKNINSFKAVEKAIQYEFERQTKALEAGEVVAGETRTWNEADGQTAPMRSKETSADYRYFPEPDLPRVAIEVAENVGHMLPEQQREKLSELGVSREIAQALLDKGHYDRIVKIHSEAPELVVDASRLYLAVPGLHRIPFDQQLQALKVRKRDGLTTSRFTEIIEHAENTGQTINETVGANESIDLSEVSRSIITEYPTQVEQYKSGKEVVLNFLVGQVMAKTKGRANIQLVRSELEKALKS